MAHKNRAIKTTNLRTPEAAVTRQQRRNLNTRVLRMNPRTVTTRVVTPLLPRMEKVQLFYIEQTSRSLAISLTFRSGTKTSLCAHREIENLPRVPLSVRTDKLWSGVARSNFHYVVKTSF